MYLIQWFRNRGAEFVFRRGRLILSRYGLTKHRILRDIQQHVASLAIDGCSPSLPIPGIIVQRFPEFVRQLQAAGAELAVHGFYHIDLNTLSIDKARQQLERADAAFQKAGIEFSGFRCPYVRCSEELLASIPPGTYDYSSNQAVHWEIVQERKSGSNGRAHKGNQELLDVINSFYQPRSAEKYVCVPWTRPNYIEIPFCVPDDLQLHDGYGQNPEEMLETWRKILQLTYARGELFTVLYHSELTGLCARPLSALVCEAREMNPQVWVTRLREISTWWREKASFAVQVEEDGDHLTLDFQCSDRATVLARGLEASVTGCPWYAGYQRVSARRLRVPSAPRPFVGLAEDTPAETVTFLQEQGYLLEVGKRARECAVFLDSQALLTLDNQVKLVEYIEHAPGPLVRYGRWPDGARSAFCVSGDMDALSLMDYAARILFP